MGLHTPAAHGPALPRDEASWEALWAPYDEPTYRAVLDRVGPADVVLEIGAGDLRLSRRLARAARKVYALEIQHRLMAQATKDGRPDNLVPIAGDARLAPFPEYITVAVLLMRHCTHFPLYLHKCSAAGCHRMLTNARWRMGVEEIDLSARPRPYEAVDAGWYACRCGRTGFVTAPPETITPAVLASSHEVVACPGCVRKTT